MNNSNFLDHRDKVDIYYYTIKRGIPQKTREELGKEAKGHELGIKTPRQILPYLTLPPPPTGGDLTPTLRVGNPATTETTPIPRRLLNRLRGAEEPTPNPLGEGAVSENRLGTQVYSASRPQLPGRGGASNSAGQWD